MPKAGKHIAEFAVAFAASLLSLCARGVAWEVAGAGAETFQAADGSGDSVLSFTDASSSGTINLTGAVKARVLLVGGGGAGASPAAATTSQGGAGGGGAGGMVEIASHLFKPGTYTVNIGAGGAAGTDGSQSQGADGGASSIVLDGTALWTALGGGGGGIKGAGRSGGSGGGGSRTGAGGAATQPDSASGGYGFAGGRGANYQAGGGGGGAGGAGGDTTATNVGGSGGPGRDSDITGASVVYAAGGGGGTRGHSASASTGGTGGLGDGSGNGGYGTSTSPKTRATAGVRGGGGGGGCYGQSGAAGGDGVVIVRILFTMPEKPADASFPYDGAAHLAYGSSEAYTITDASGAVVDAATATTVGDYAFTFTLNDGYCWADGSTDAATATLSITKPKLVVESISVSGWQVGQTPGAPVIVTNIPLADDEYEVVYSASASDPWSATAPDAAGTYYATIKILRYDNFTAPDDIPVSDAFRVWEWNDDDVRLDELGYHAKVSLSGYTGTTLTDFPMLVRFSENSPEGFSYAHARADGSDLRFLDEDGNQLPFEIDEWNADGESYVWVKVPEYKNGVTVTACWGELAGVEIPDAPDSSETWTAYSGVWHMNEEIDAATAAATQSKDSTAGANHATPVKGTASASNLSQMVSTEGALGRGRLNATGACTQRGNRLLLSGAYAFNGTFTISGWFHVDGYGIVQQFAGNKTGASSAANNSGTGWGLENIATVTSAGTPYTRMFLRGTGSNAGGGNITGNFNTEWVHVAAVYDGTKARLYTSGVKLGNDITIASVPDTSNPIAFGNNSDGSAGSLYGGYDEIRLAPVARSAEWIKAEHDQIAGDVSAGWATPVYTAPDSTFVNRWVVEPSVSYTEWEKGGEPPTVTAGVAAYGDAYWAFVATSGEAFVNAVPGEAGEYVLWGYADAATGEGGAKSWTALADPFAGVTVLSRTPYSDLSGGAGSATLSGRVLLANDDDDGEQSITDQDYDQTDASAATHWVHSGDAASYLNLSGATSHDLVHASAIDELCGGATIWHLDNIRIGNAYHNDQGSMYPSRNYLPWSDAGGGQMASSHLAFANAENAAVYSPCYTNGIGTVYFDAVNLASASAGGYTLVVEVSTNCLDGAGIPSDANVHTMTEGYETTTENDDGTTTTTYVDPVTNFYANAEWFPVKLLPLRTDGKGGFNALDATYALDATLPAAGSATNFYRVAAKVDAYTPARFRIRRATADSSVSGATVGFILVDNVIASYPAMRADLSPRGVYDAAKGGKQILGREAAWATPFPAVGEDGVLARAVAAYKVNPGLMSADESSFVTAAKMHYRWRYLDQVVEDDWKTVGLDQRNGYVSPSAVDLSGYGPGDVEFFYELTLSAPYYDYHDYSGYGAGLAGLYTENVSTVTNRADAGMYQSRGTDWFVRLREGRSDYEAVNLLVRPVAEDGTANATNIVEMELVADHVWRGCYQTLDPIAGGIKFRFEALNKQTPGAEEWEENSEFWYSREDAETLPVSAGGLAVGGDDDWTSAPCDAATGYLLFQIDDSTKSLTVVRADCQDFNAWSDANKGGLFVGSSVEDALKSGSSPRAVAHTEDFSGWRDMAATNANWTETFTTSAYLGVDDYDPFDSADSPNGWALGPGMYVYGRYKDSRTGRAYQMEGNGKGHMDFVNSAVSPRGLESVSFNARLAQSIEFSDLAYYDAADKASMSNYTFLARAKFDTANGASFTGAATLSLVAYHRPDVGCYEFRVEQGLGANVNTATGSASLYRRGQIFSLYRWLYNEDGDLDCTCLGSVTNTAFDTDVNSTSGSGGWLPLYLSVTNANNVSIIMAGMKRASMTASAALSETAAAHFNVVYRDTSDKRLESGTYGVATANSPGRFTQLYQSFVPVPQMNNYSTANQIGQYSNNTPSFHLDGGEIHACREDISGGRWYVTPGRFERYDSDANNWGLSAKTPTQTLSLYTAPAGRSTGWKLIAATNFTSFGSATTPTRFTVYTTDDCSVKIAAGGTARSRRTDIAIDDVTIRQWRGADWETVNSALETPVPNWTSETDYAAHTNFVFSSAWIEGESLLLSARRTKPGTPSSIRSPLFDGAYDRGLGLGMFSFAYSNAQENARLLLQIATNNVSYTTVASIDNLDSATWTTVTNFDFSASTAAERRSGSRSCYLGLHGVKGVMRLVVDPALVNAISNSTDTAKFGEIFVTEVLCRDEPVLDSSCWWGWNLRTLGADSNGADSEGRMYLPDLTTSPTKVGMSLALNDSVTDDVDASDDQTYIQHLPFIQTPTFGTNLVGEISFRARKYDASSSQPALLTLYGSRTGEETGVWSRLAYFAVTNTTYGTYSFKTEQSAEPYRAFRLAVIGVEDAIEQQMHGTLPVEDADGNAVYPYSTPVRVLIDDVLVSEAVRASVGFKNVGAFRNTGKYDALNLATAVPGVPGEDWQPLCNEAWGVQCEVEAKQLPDEVDFNRTPVVRFHWFVGDYPWGFENWRTNRNAKSAMLARATDTNLVYRSSYLTARDAIVDPVTVPGRVVQYSLEVVWYPKGEYSPVTNFLSSADWTTPDWYAPLDLNAGQESFSAYNILDTVAPHWAWINEVNIFGEYDRNYANTDSDLQYVEVAVPAEANITGWRVNLLEAQMGNGVVLTNCLGIFGSGNLQATKTGLIGSASNMVFRVLANKASSTSGNLSVADGTIDAVWNVDHPTVVFNRTGEILSDAAIGLQLVRASGIVEHEIAVRGYDFDSWFQGTDPVEPREVSFLNSVMKGAKFFFVGDDDGGVPNSLSVLESRGETSNRWSKAVAHTPGRINEGQFIDPDHPTPNGTSIIVYANLDETVGHIYQTFGDAVETNGNVLVFITKGSELGTNITYTVDNWYELASVTVDGVPAAFTTNSARSYTVNGVGRGATKAVTVTAAAKVQESLEAAGIDERFREAVLDWLSAGKDANGNDWAHPNDGEVRLASFVPYSAWRSNPNAEGSQLDLTTMYWLDMDPTVGDLALVGGIAKAPGPVIVDGYLGSESVTNVRMGVFMLITNRTADAASEWYGGHWTPYVLRGREPGSLSWDYSPSGAAWNGPTFKITGILANGLTSESNKSNWIPLRWFVFNADSFDQSTFTSSVEVKDPYGTESPAAGYINNWRDWVKEHGYTPVFFGWAIDTRTTPMGAAEVMGKENHYETE